MRTFFRALKGVSVVTLLFFSWTYLPLYQIAAYAVVNKQTSKNINSGPVKQKPEEKLEQLLDDLREKTGKAEQKSTKGEDNASEIEAIKSKKAEIEALDAALRKDFAATEKKLKDAELPKEILSRHRAFVKHYKDNIAELKANIDSIEKAKTPSMLRAELAKTRKHVARVKHPRKRIPLDPNKLPNRTRAIKKPVIEQKKPDKKKRKPVQLRKRAHVNPGKGIETSGSSYPILAFNGPLYGLLSDYSQTVTPLSSIFDTHLMPDDTDMTGTPSIAPFEENQQANLLLDSVFMQAMTTYTMSEIPPTQAELAETPDVQFTQAIKDLAAQHDYRPSKLYFWVYNNIDIVPTYGSIQGADMCLQTKICNPYDTASLLIALFRASGVHAKYAYGTIEIQMDIIMKWLGVTDPRVAGTILASNGIPVRLLISGGEIKYVQMEHVWVNAWLDYIPSRGAVHKQGDTWIPLDPSIKFYETTPGMDIQSAVPFDAQAFADQIQATATINETEGYVTNVNSALVQQTMQDYQTRVQNYIRQNHPDATVGDVLGKRTIKQINWRIMPCTTMFLPRSIAWEGAALPDNLRASIEFRIPGPSGAGNGLLYTTSLPEIAGKKITLAFSAASATDQAVIDAFQSDEETISLPAYLINLKPELTIDGVSVATGASTTMGTVLSWTISLNEPGIGLSNIDNTITAGQYFAIGLDTGRMGINQLNNLKAKLLSTKTNIESGNTANLTNDDLIGDILYSTIASYFSQLDFFDEMTARNMNIIRSRAPSIGTFSIVLDSKEVFGVPVSISQKGMMMDVGRIMQAVFSKAGNFDLIKQYMIASGNNSSALEHAVPEQIFSTPASPVNGISAIKALKIANDQGIPIHKINLSNSSAIIPQLQISENVKTDIINAVNAGKIVTVSKKNISAYGWSGCGYSIVDGSTGAGAYMIDGGFNGSIIEAFFSSIVDLIAGSMKKGYIKPSQGIGLVGKLAAGATVLSFGLTMYNIAMDPNLSVEQKIINIIAWTITTCIALALTNPILALTPCWGLIAITAVYVAMTALALFVTTDFSDTSSP